MSVEETEVGKTAAVHHHTHTHLGTLGGTIWATYRSIFALAVYFGIGALCHAVALGPTFDRSSMWSWGWILAWPFAFLGYAAKWIAIVLLAIVVLCALAWVGYVIWKAIEIRIWVRRARDRGVI